jgi:restriction endonuclease S subunit
MTETESNYYIRFSDEIVESRIDENYNNPKYGEIVVFLNKSRYDNIFELGDRKYLINIVSGKTPKGIHYVDDGIPFLGGSNIFFEKVYVETAPKISKDIHDTILASSKIKKDNILITMAGTIGRCAVYNQLAECNANQAIAILQFNTDEILPEYLSHYLNSRLGQLFFSKLQHISSQPNINLEEIKKIKVILPKSSEQKEILGKVRMEEEEAIKIGNEVNNVLFKAEKTFLDELGIDLETELEKIDYYIKSIDELSRLDFEFNNLKYDILEKLISQSNTSFVELSEVVDFLQDSRNPMKYPDKEFIYIDIGNINTKWGTLNPIMMCGKDATSSRMRRVMYGGAVLVSTTRPTRNAISIVPNELDNQICSTALAVLRCKNDMNNKFLFYALRTQLTRLQFERYCSGSGYPEINQEIDIQKIKIPKPNTMQEQLKIVEKIENLLKEAKEKEHKSQEKWQEAKDTFEKLILKGVENG